MMILYPMVGQFRKVLWEAMKCWY